jgi:DNA repair exonuclease SbcCD ATPase subunit
MNKFQRVYHIADVHARLFNRMNEYRQVIDRFLEKISELGTDDAIICILGDVSHTKTDTSAEQFDIITYLLKSCSELCPTVVIPGNHDLNLSAKNRLELLSPIVQAINSDNLYYSKNTEIFDVGNIRFTHFSLMENKGEWTFNKLSGKQEYNIALYHGVINGCNLENENFVLDSHGIEQDIFEKFDLTLLGDIHKRQFLNAEKTVAYCGSFIQQDFSETLEKGFLEWNLKTKKAKFHRVENDYGFVTVHIENGKADIDLDSIPKKSRVRVIHNDEKLEVIDSVIKKISKRTNIEELKINNNTVDRAINTKMSADNIMNVRDVARQNKLIKDFFDLAGIDISDEDLEVIHRINSEINSELSTAKGNRNIIWKPILFEFSNMFSFGENNVIDFTKLDDVVGLFAANASGKSSIFSALCFCLFDKCDKTNKASVVMNKNATEFKCVFLFEINSIQYIIERVGTTAKNGKVSVAVTFGRMINNEYELLSGKMRSDTNKIISEYIGTYEDFILTSLSTQVDNRSIIDMTQKERQELLYRFLDVSVFSELHDIGKEKYKEYKIICANRYNKDYLNEISELENNIVELTEKLEINEEEIRKCESKQRSLQADIDSVNKQYIKIEDYPSKTKDEYEVLISEALSSIEECNNKVITSNKLLEEYKAESKNISKKLDDIDISESESMVDSLSKLLEDDREVSKNILKLENDISHLQSKVDRLKEHKFNPDCEYCVSNPFVIDAYAAKDLIKIKNKELEKLKSNRIDVEAVTKDLEAFKAEIKVVSDLRLEKAKKDTKVLTEEKSLLTLKNSKESYESKILQYKNNIKTIEKNKKSIEFNKTLDIQFEELTAEKNEFDVFGKKLVKERDTIVYDKRSSEESLEKLKAELKESKEKTYLMGIYDRYCSAVCKDGIPYMILKNILPLIESEVNNILSSIVSFNFKLEIDENDDVEAYVMYDDVKWPVECSSGMERFVISTAIRTSLVRLSSLPKPTFMVIDEGFGVLDREKLTSISQLLAEVKKNFDFIICISHLLEIRDAVNMSINVSKENGISHIEI